MAATAAPPPNWLKFTVTLAMVSVLLSPAGGVVPGGGDRVADPEDTARAVAPLTLMLAAVTVG